MLIEQKDLDNHAAKIVFCEGLEDLTAKQVQQVCFLMEMEYQKGVVDATKFLNKILRA